MPTNREEIREIENSNLVPPLADSGGNIQKMLILVQRFEKGQVTKIGYRSTKYLSITKEKNPEWRNLADNNLNR